MYYSLYYYAYVIIMWRNNHFLPRCVPYLSMQQTKEVMILATVNYSIIEVPKVVIVFGSRCPDLNPESNISHTIISGAPLSGAT